MNTAATVKLGRRATIRVSARLAAAALVVGVSAGTGVATAASSTSNAPYKVNFSYIGTTAIPTGPWGYAYTKGLLQKWLKPYGITLSLSHFANGPLMTAAMVGGSVDVGNLGDTPALIARSQGLKSRLITQSTVGQAAWIVAQPSIHSLSQLAGKTIAVQQGSYLDRYLQGLLAEKGLLSKVKRVAMLTAQSTPAFESGSIDAVLISPTLWPSLQKNNPKYNLIAKSETTPKLEGTGLTIATDKILAAHPDLAKDWNAVRVKSIKYTRAHANAYYSWEAKQNATTVALEKLSGPVADNPIPNFTTAGINQLQGTLNFLVQQKEAKPFSIKQWELQ